MSEQPIVAAAGDETAAIQAAMDRASAANGGRVSLRAGKHRSAGLQLRSGVELHLEAGAELLLAADYDAYASNQVGVVAEESDRACIFGQGLAGCAITGTGTIRAPGRAYVAGDDPEVGTHVPARLRPRVLVLDDCTDVTLSGFAIEDSPMWTVHLVACTGVQIDGLSIRNDRLLPNTDGIVIDSSTDVTITHVSIVTADDGVCLKTTRRVDGIGPCRNVTVRKSRVSSRSCALKIGTETFGDITDVMFEDCVVADSNRGLGIFSRDGGRISGIRFSRVALECNETPDGFWGSGEAITMTRVTRRTAIAAGAISNVTFEDITGSMQGAINMVSDIAGGINHVRLSRVSLDQRPGPLGTARRYDLRPTSADLNPEARGRANAWTKGADGVVVGLLDYPGGMPGLYATGVENIAIEDVAISRPVTLPTGWNPELIVGV